MSIIEVVGFAHYWDLTINGVATIYFLICVGLAVDYSAHIGHTFNVCQGASNERAMKALKQIGPSVVHALMSTLLAICVVAFSKSYVFQVRPIELLTVLIICSRVEKLKAVSSIVFPVFWVVDILKLLDQAKADLQTHVHAHEHCSWTGNLLAPVSDASRAQRLVAICSSCAGLLQDLILGKRAVRFAWCLAATSFTRNLWRRFSWR
eukprot:714618-Amphidinium_carterae.1